MAFPPILNASSFRDCLPAFIERCSPSSLTRSYSALASASFSRNCLSTSSVMPISGLSNGLMPLEFGLSSHSVIGVSFFELLAFALISFKFLSLLANATCSSSDK